MRPAEFGDADTLLDESWIDEIERPGSLQHFDELLEITPFEEDSFLYDQSI